VRQTLDRAEKFLGLAALVAVVLAAVAIALAASRYLRRHLDTAAMLRCFGAAQRRTLALFVVQFAVLGVVASLVGVLAGLAGQELLVTLLGGITAAELPPPAPLPGIAAFGTGVLLLFGFALPPLIALSSVPPLRVLRRDLPRPRPSALVAYGLGATVIAVLVGWQAQDFKAAGIMIGGIAGLLVAAGVVAWLLIVLLKRLPQRGVTWRFGLANLRRRPLASSLQIGALALGLMALLLLTVVRGDLMQNWRQSLPADAPNHFVVNVLPDQVEGVRAALRAGAGTETELYPMVRGRLVAVNGKPLETSGFEDARARRLAEREFNLSWAAVMPSTNRVVAGTFWAPSAGKEAGLSMEEGIAKSLRLKLGDTLTYDIAGTPVSAPITSLRKRLGQLPAQLLHAVSAGGAGGHAADLAGRGARARRAGQRRLAVGAGPRIPERAGDRRRRDHPAGAVDHGPGRARRRVRVPVHARRRAAGAAGGDRRDAGRAPVRCGGAAHAGRLQRAAQRRAAGRVAGAGALAGLLAAGGATAVGYVLADRVFQIPFSANPLVWLYGLAGGRAR
jgi:putative ABC transport system permease protein